MSHARASVHRFLAATILALGLAWAQPAPATPSRDSRPRIELTTTDDDHLRYVPASEPRMPAPASGVSWTLEPPATARGDAPSLATAACARGDPAPDATGDPTTARVMARFRAGQLWYPHVVLPA